MDYRWSTQRIFRNPHLPGTVLLYEHILCTAGLLSSFCEAEFSVVHIHQAMHMCDDKETLSCSFQSLREEVSCNVFWGDTASQLRDCV